MKLWLAFLISITCGVQQALPIAAQTKLQTKKTASPNAKECKLGEELIKAYQCASCHVINGKGATGGVVLDNLKRSKTFIVDHLLDPEEHLAKNAAAFNFDPNLMPSHQLTVMEARAMAEYLLHKTKPASQSSKKTRQ